ncbi:MAG: tail fiber domain-containing protein [Clostridia bacterium]|nr:tail fiber domain-containing protein [Clostridia bacterium]
MSSKQDVTYTRTAADFERKYNFGRSFSEILGIANDAQTHAYNAEEIAKRVEAKVLDVEAKVLNIDVLEKLNVSAGTIELKSKGLSIQSEYFSLSAENGIKTTRGNIGLWDISENGILKYTDNYFVRFNAPINQTDDVLIVAKQSDGVVTDIPFYLKADGTVKMNKGIIGEDIDVYGTIRAKEISSYTDDTWNETAKIYYDNRYFYFEVTNHATNSQAGLKIYRDDNDVYAKTSTLYAEDEANWSEVICYSAKAEIFSTDTIFLNSPYFSCVTNHGAFRGEYIFRDNVSFNNSVSFKKEEKEVTIIGEDAIRIGNATSKKVSTFNMNDNLTIYSQTGMWFGVENGYTGVLAGSWRLDSGATVTSDRNRKHDIKDMPSEYRILFDNLRPVIHKYDNGTSNRYHTAFIAQEVDEAITKAGLTRQDFAGLCIENEGKDNELWSLRYGEFVALNTYEIQKLKKELADIKAKIGA